MAAVGSCVIYPSVVKQGVFYTREHTAILQVLEQLGV